jgi:putative redox protein
VYHAANVQNPTTTTSLTWEHDLVFSGQTARAGGADPVLVTFDSAGAAGPSPVQGLAFSLAACMAMDVVHILKKGRHALRGLRADLTAVRASDHPRRLIRVDLHFIVTGAIAADHVERAIALSRETYCSVWHSLREDIDFRVTFAVSPGM